MPPAEPTTRGECYDLTGDVRGVPGPGPGAAGTDRGTETDPGHPGPRGSPGPDGAAHPNPPNHLAGNPGPGGPSGTLL